MTETSQGLDLDRAARIETFRGLLGEIQELDLDHPMACDMALMKLREAERVIDEGRPLSHNYSEDLFHRIEEFIDGLRNRTRESASA